MRRVPGACCPGTTRPAASNAHERCRSLMRPSTAVTSTHGSNRVNYRGAADLSCVGALVVVAMTRADLVDELLDGAAFSAVTDIHTPERTDGDFVHSACRVSSLRNFQPYTSLGRLAFRRGESMRSRSTSRLVPTIAGTIPAARHWWRP